MACACPLQVGDKKKKQGESLANHAAGVDGIARVRADGIDTKCRMESMRSIGWNQADEGVCSAECHTAREAHRFHTR